MRLPYRTLIAVATLFMMAACQDQEPDVPSPQVDLETVDQSESSQRTSPPVLGKGPGMGHDYQKNTPSSGQGKPNYRGGRAEQESQQDESWTTPFETENKEGDEKTQESKHQKTEEKLESDSNKIEFETDNNPAKTLPKQSNDTLDQPG